MAVCFRENSLCALVRALFQISIQQKCATFNQPHVSVFKNYLAKFIKSTVQQSLRFPRDTQLTNLVALARLWQSLTQQKLGEASQTATSFQAVTRTPQLRQSSVSVLCTKFSRYTNVSDFCFAAPLPPSNHQLFRIAISLNYFAAASAPHYRLIYIIYRSLTKPKIAHNYKWQPKPYAGIIFSGPSLPFFNAKT